MSAEVQPVPTYVKIVEGFQANPDPIPFAFAPDDLILLPKYSTIRSREDVSTATELVKGIEMHIPIISANMSTVTEWRMGVALAQLGGLGVIHRAMSIEDQVAQVRRVKEATNYIVLDPPRLNAGDTVEHARAVMEERQRGFALVVDQGLDIGLITTRDVGDYAPSDSRLVDIMTSRERLHVAPYVAPSGISMDDAQREMWRHRVEKLPLVNERGEIVAVIADRDIRMQKRYPHATKDSQGRLRVGAAIGTEAGSKERAQALIAAGVDLIVVDVMHGDHISAHEMVDAVKRLTPTVPIMAGNVATADATRGLADAGADSVKAGFGPGQMCTTQVETGTGSQQGSAVMESATVLYRDYPDVTLNADGGVRSGGDITKLLASGADHVMIGTTFGGTDESPGEIEVDDETGDMHKVVIGMASEQAQVELAKARGGKRKDRAPQGTTAKVVYIGSVERVVKRYVGGLVSGMANTGSATIEELQHNAQFRRVTGFGREQGTPHVRSSRQRR